MPTKRSGWVLAAALAAALVIAWAWSTNSERAVGGQAAGPAVSTPLDGGAAVAPRAGPAVEPRPQAQPAESEKMERLRSLVDTDPSAALELSRQIERELPSGQMADERSLLAMKALVHLGKIAVARDEATAFFQKYPESPWAQRVERLTGVHPHGSGPRR